MLTVYNILTDNKRGEGAGSVTPPPIKLGAQANFKIKRPYTNNVEYAIITPKEMILWVVGFYQHLSF